MRFIEVPRPTNARLPLIYMWEIHTRDGSLIGRYVGKANAGAERPRTHYVRNVTNLLAGKPYREGNPNGYRRVHVALAAAVRNGHLITLQLLCNVQPGEDINEVERRLIEERGCRGIEAWQLNG